MRDLQNILDWLLTAHSAPQETERFDTFWADCASEDQAFTLPFDCAVVGGARATGFGFAFAAGYQWALRSLFGTTHLKREDIGALCVTESGGGHPKHMETRIETRENNTLYVSGRKSFVTLGNQANRLFVVANEGFDDTGRRKLAVLALSAPGPGIELEMLPDLPFVPEVPHAAVNLDVEIAPSARLEGDGYVRYVKPFRTVEDIHVFGALLGHVLAVLLRQGGEQSRIERLLSVLSGLRSVSAENPSSPAVHLALAGALKTAKAMLGTLFQELELPNAERYQRDAPLLEIASVVRRARTARAWERLKTQ